MAKTGERRRALRERAVSYKGGKCQICGYDKCPAAFEFHHIDNVLKNFSISTKMQSWKVIKPELDRCALVCSNCHKEIHDGLHPKFLEQEEAFYDDETLEDLGR